MADTFETEKYLLDSVNILLETINENPIETEADYDYILEARIAKAKILEVKKAILSERWDFNRDTNYILPLDELGNINVPANILDVSSKDGDIVMRNWLLYSKSNQTTTFKEEQKVDIVWDMDFNGLSHALRHYITIRAARIFAARTIGDKVAIQFNSIDEEDAMIAARRSDGRTGSYNMLTSDYGVRNKGRL